MNDDDDPEKTSQFGFIAEKPQQNVDFYPKEADEQVALNNDDFDDDLEPNTVDYYNFSDPMTKFDFQPKSHSQLSSAHHSRRNSPGFLSAQRSPLGHYQLSKEPTFAAPTTHVPIANNIPDTNNYEIYQWESLFTPVENVENIVDRYLEKEVLKVIQKTR